jgi:hypothetical protein
MGAGRCLGRCEGEGKFYFLGRGACSFEKGNFEGRKARRIAFLVKTYTYHELNVYVLGQVALPLMWRGFQKKKTHLTFPI